MDTKNAGPSGSQARRSTILSAPNGNTPGKEHPYSCPLCDGGNASYAFKRHYDGDVRALFHCHSIECQNLAGRYIHELVGALQAPSVEALKDAPHDYLGSYVRRSNGDRPPDPLPSGEQIERWRRRCLRNAACQRYLHRERGLAAGTVKAAGIGYAEPGEVDGVWSGYAAFTLPVYDGGELVNVVRKFWPSSPLSAKGKPVKYAGLRGRGTQLYPEVDMRDGRRACIVEGPFDALIMREHGFNAYTSTHGTNWAPEWNERFTGCLVAMIYDPEGFKRACQLAAQLSCRRSRTRAWAVDLAAAGLGPKEDLTDFFVKYGRTASKLRELIRAARKAGGR